MIDIGDRCTHCGRDTAFGSVDENGEKLLLFVNRIPSDTDEHSGYMCVDCQQIECDLCGEMTLDYSLETGQAVCGECESKMFTVENKQTAVDLVCGECGSHDLQFPAYCKWNPVTQAYEFTDILVGEALCYGQCDGAGAQSIEVSYSAEEPDWFRYVTCDTCGNVEGLPADEQRHHFSSFTFDIDWTCNGCGTIAEEEIADQNLE